MNSQTNTLEECYEYLLSFAAQGLTAEKDSERDRSLRSHLQSAVDALLSLESSAANLIVQADLQPAKKYQAFFAIMVHDAKKAATAIELVLAQPAISAQLVDNLNASMHLRTLLTDLFLISEVLKPLEAHAAN
jgi:hypothetical protein